MTQQKTFLALILFLGLMIAPAVFASEVTGNLNTGLNAGGVQGTVNNCNPLTILNGTIGAYPTCAITCNEGYELSEGACVVSIQTVTVTTCQQLQDIENHHNWIYNLGGDVDCSGFSFRSISNFSGTLDGAGHKIINLNVTIANSNWGLFSNTDSSAIIKNLGLENVNINGSGYTGAIVGGWNSGLIKNCYVTGTITADYQQVGGIAGSNGGTIEKCFVNIQLQGSGYTGGIAGANSGLIKNCYVKGDVTANNDGGGVVGLNEYGGANIQNSYSVATIHGANNGGLIGWQYSGATQSNAYWDIATSGKTSMCYSNSMGGLNCDDTHGLTDTQMKQQSSFSGWDFEDTWAIDSSKNGGYPYLRWQTTFPGSGDTVKPVITLLGSATVSVIVGNTYTDAGATALDNVDGDITSRIVKTGSVNTNVAATYIITYDVSDTAGNAATQVARAVIVSAASSGGGGGGGGGGTVIPTTTPKPGDFNSDGKVDMIDLNTLMLNWGQTGSNISGDLNQDGKVNLLDFSILMLNWTV